MTTINVEAVIQVVDQMAADLQAALAHLLEENPDVADLSGDSLRNLATTNDSLTLTGGFLQKWGGARSMNGAILELEQLRTALLMFEEIKPILNKE